MSGDSIGCWEGSKPKLKAWLIYLSVGYGRTLEDLVWSVEDYEVIDQMAIVEEEVKELVRVLREREGGI